MTLPSSIFGNYTYYYLPVDIYTTLDPKVLENVASLVAAILQAGEEARDIDISSSLSIQNSFYNFYNYKHPQSNGTVVVLPSYSAYDSWLTYANWILYFSTLLLGVRAQVIREREEEEGEVDLSTWFSLLLLEICEVVILSRMIERIQELGVGSILTGLVHGFNIL